MNRVLVYVPQNEVHKQAAIRFTTTKDKADEYVKEGSIDSNSAYAGARIVPIGEWPLHRFIPCKATGDPIQDPDLPSMTRSELEEREARLQSIQEAEAETVGEMDNKIKSLESMIIQMKTALEEKDAAIVAKAKEAEAEKIRAETLGVKEKSKEKKK